jgi:hypothetical protein
LKAGTCLWCLAFILLLGLFSAIASDLWYAEYDAGLKAIAAKDWTTAESKLKTALSLQPKQGRQVLAYGVRFIRYIPEYYLGVVRFNQGRYQDALDGFERVQKKGLVVQGDAEFAQMITMMQAGTEKLKPKQKIEPVTPPVAAPEKPKAEETKSEQQRTEAELQAQRLEEEKRKREQFNNLIQKADASLNAKQFRQSQELAKQAAALGVDETRTGDLLKRIDLAEKLDALMKAVNKKDWVAAQKVAQQVAALDPKNRELIASQPFIEKGLSDLKVQDLEDRGLLAFLSGDYQQAIVLLERVVVESKDSAEPWFYLGCSHAAQGLLQGKKGVESLQKAQREFAQSRKLDPKLTDAHKLISPRILELYQQSQ